MSDYLKNLAMRSIGSPATVQPRPRARFEASDSNPIESAMDTETVIANAASTPSSKAAVTSPTFTSPAPRSHRAVSESDAQPNRSTGIQSEANQSQSTCLLPQHKLAQQTIVPIPTEESPVNEEHKAPNLLTPAHENRESQTSDNEPAQRESKAQGLPLETQIHHVETALAFEPAYTAESPRATQTENSPIIRITIGRVEVRATQPPHNNSKPRIEKPKPALPLTDYLTARREGNR